MFIHYNINLLEHIHNMNTINMYASLIQWMQHRIYIVVLLTDVNTWNETWKVLINLIIHEFPKNRRGKNGQFRNLCFSATWVSGNISWIFPSEVAEPGYRNPMNQWITGNALYNFWLLFGIKAFESNGFRSNGFFLGNPLVPLIEEKVLQEPPFIWEFVAPVLGHTPVRVVVADQAVPKLVCPRAKNTANMNWIGAIPLLGLWCYDYEQIPMNLEHRTRRTTKASNGGAGINALAWAPTFTTTRQSRSPIRNLLLVFRFFLAGSSGLNDDEMDIILPSMSLLVTCLYMFPVCVCCMSVR